LTGLTRFAGLRWISAFPSFSRELNRLLVLKGAKWSDPTFSDVKTVNAGTCEGKVNISAESDIATWEELKKQSAIRSVEK
jgi:hypothetical protein